MIILATAWLLILLVKTVLTLNVIRRERRQKYQPLFEKVTIIQPILSGDPTLASVLETNVIALEQASFMWLIDDNDAVAKNIVNHIQQCYPDKKITVRSFPQAPEGINPKAFKLEHAWREADNEVILVLDDDAMLSAAALAQLLAEMGEDTLVTALPYYTQTGSRYSALLAQFVNDNSALTYLPLLPWLPPLTINGMCYALTTKTLASVGGFAPIQHHLTDDLAMASLLNQHQIRLIQSTALVKIQTHLSNGKKYIQQMHRWFLFATLLLREKPLKINVLIFLLQGLHPLLLWLMLLNAFSHPLIFIGCLAIRQLAIAKVQQEMTADIRARPVLSLLSELLQPLHLFHALCNRTIVWRTRRYRVLDNKRFISDE